MNERIKELAVQAGFTKCKFYDGDEYLDKPITPISSISIDSELGKFAELIVRECSNIAYNTQYKHSVAHTRGDCATAIKEHFGVDK